MPVFQRPDPKREEHDMTLDEPLLENEKDMEDKDRTTSLKSQNKADYLAGRIYASNAPRIFLETITARTATIMILITYVVFIIGFSYDLFQTYRSFNSSNYIIDAYSCNTNPITPPDPDVSYTGCSFKSTWNSTVTQLENVISIELSVKQVNVTSLLVNASDTFSIVYNAQIWACYNQDGCGSNFDISLDYTTDPNIWQKVLTLSNASVNIDLSRDVHYDDDDGSLTVELVSNTFQNEESVPTNGLVQSYFLSIKYVYAPYDLFTAQNEDTQQYITYEYDVVSRPTQHVVDVISIFMLAITFVLLIGYCYVLHQSGKKRRILSEQKWIVAYLVLVIFFQNPVYLIIVWFKSPPPGAAYTSYLISFLGQSGLFILWLLFADPVHRKTQSKLLFYSPKVFTGLAIFTAALVVLTFQFPGLDPTDPHRNAVEAVQNWTESLKLDFIGFTMLYMLLIWVWTVWWFIQLIRTGRKLKKLPYMSTRYMQLSYRFFAVQATLVTLYYVLQYAAVIYFISLGARNGANVYDLTSLTDNINTLFRQQTQLFGKSLFLTVYAITLAFFYLPADVLDNTGIAASMAATYTITEEEHRTVVASRKKTLNKINKNLLNQMTGMNQLVNAKVDVFCVDLALNMRNIAFQAYYDFADLKTASGYEGEIDLASIGYELVDKFYSKDYELFCFIAREKVTQRLVVTFRGTASKKQMEANLKYSQIPVNFETLELSTLDQLDGLNVRKKKEDDLELQSVSDDEEEDFWEKNDIESEGGVIRGESEAGPGVNRSLSLRPVLSIQPTPRETMLERADQVREGLSKAFTGAVGATNQGIHAVVDATTGLMVTAATNTPMLKTILLPYVHSGFWEAYCVVRGFIHARLRQELMRLPTTVIFTGHSLGGALATFAAMDVQMHTVPRVNAYLKHHAKLLFLQERDRRAIDSIVPSRDSRGNSLISNSPPRSRSYTAPSRDPDSDTEDKGTKTLLSSGILEKRNTELATPVFVKKIKVMMYNFGSPRVGNRNFAQVYNKLVPSSFRVVVDGDIVAGLPPSKYQHIGTEILIDSLGSGSIIIDPSFVERWLRTHLKSSVAVHSLLVYRKGLLGLKLAAEYLKLQYAKARSENPNADPLRLAIQMRTKHKFEDMLNIAPEFGDLTYTATEQPVHTTSTLHDIEAGAVDIVAGSAKARPSLDNAIELQLSMASAADGLGADEENRVLSSAEEKKDSEGTMLSRHYAHDVENMTALMSQIRSLQSASGPVQWVKKHTVDRMKGKKGGSNKFNSRMSTKSNEDSRSSKF